MVTLTRITIEPIDLLASSVAFVTLTCTSVVRRAREYGGWEGGREDKCEY